MSEKKMCPKCRSKMEKGDGPFAIPAYVEPNVRDKGKMAISTKVAIPLDVYRCSNCQYLEFFAQ